MKCTASLLFTTLLVACDGGSKVELQQSMVPVRRAPVGAVVKVDIPTRGTLYQPNDWHYSYPEARYVTLPAHVGWWQFDPGWAGRVLDGRLDLGPSDGARAIVGPKAIRLRAKQRAPLQRKLDKEAFAVDDGSTITTNLRITSSPWDEDDHLARATRMSQESIPTSLSDEPGDFYVSSDASVDQPSADHLYTRGGLACRAMDWHVVLDDRHGIFDAQLSALVEVVSMLLDEEVEIDAALIHDTGQCSSISGISASVVDNVKYDLCERLLASGHGLRGCGRILGMPLEACGMQLYPGTEFVCHDPGFSDLDALLDYTFLTKVDVSGTSVRSIAALESLPDLEHVNLSDTLVEDLRPLRRTKVSELDIRRTPVVSVWPMQQMRRLSSIAIDGATVDPDDLTLLRERRPELTITP